MSSIISANDTTNFKYEDFLLKQDLEHVIRKTIGQESFNVGEVTVRPASNHKLGFMCEHLRMTVEVAMPNDTKILKYFLKCVPIGNEQMKEFLLSMGAFSKETKVYEIFDYLSTTLGKKPWYPTYYFANEKAIVLEDLTQRNFVSLDPRAYFTKEHCLTALSGLARLHACCLSLEEKKSKELGTKFRLEKEYAKYLDNFIYDLTAEGYYDVCMKTMLGAVEKFSKYANNPSSIKIIKSKWSETWAKNLELAQPSSVYRNVIVHRDLWGGNLMYRYENGIAKECIIIDFQTFGCQPPAADVMDVLYMNTTRKDRDLWETECVDYYYNELRQNLLEDEIKIDTIISKEDFLKSCKEYTFWALLHSCCENQTIQLKRDKLDEILEDSKTFDKVMNTLEGRKEVIFSSFESDKEYHDYILENLEQLIDTYILL